MTMFSLSSQLLVQPRPVEEALALECALDGTIRRVILDTLGLQDQIQPGASFARLVAPGNLAKALSFLTEIKTYQVAYDWEITVAIGDQAKTLHFTGEQIDQALIIVGASSRRDCLRVYDEAISAFTAAGAQPAPQPTEQKPSLDEALYDEISRLNNELVDLQRELAKKNAELERLNQEKNRFLGMAAHDLRNPLHAILNYVDFLMSDYPITTEQRIEFLGVIRSSSEFMSQLIDDLLDVAVIESGQLKLDYSAVDLNALAREVTAMNQTLASRKQIQIELTMDPFPAMVLDRTKISQVLNNLISNAVKFSEPASEVKVQLQREDGSVLISVQDHGPGIAADELANLFRPFQRGRARGTAGEKSTGLGLMIVKRIVEGHGGQIWVESRLGEGSTFYVRLPIKNLGASNSGAHQIDS